MTKDNAPMPDVYAPYTPYGSYAPYGPAGDQVEIGKLWDVFLRRWKLMLATLLVVLVAGGAYTARQKPMYESKAMMLVVSDQPGVTKSDEVNVTSDVSALTRSRSVQSQLEIITSPELLNEAVRQLREDEFVNGFGGTLPQWAVKVDSKKDSDIISILTKAYTPDAAANLANNVVVTYMDRNRQFSVEAIRQGREQLYTEMNKIKAQLTTAQKELSNFKRTTKLVVAEDQLRAIAGDSMTLKTEHDRARIEQATSQRQTEALSRQLASQGEEIQQSSTIQLSPQYQEALGTLAKLQAERASLIQEYTPDSKEVRKVDAEIAVTEQRMKQVAETITAAKVRTRNPVLSDYLSSLVNKSAVDARVNALEKVIAVKDNQLDRLPEQERTFTTIMQRVSTLQNTYQMLSQKYYTLLVNEKSALPNAVLVSSAQPAHGPSSPNKKKNMVLFFLLGTMLAIGVAAVAERCDNKVRDEGDLALITRAPLLSSIPKIGVKGSPGQLMISGTQDNSAFLESFRILRNNISLSDFSEPVKLLAVTSPNQGDGKSTASLNLAITTAMDRKKVLLVDCDLHRIMKQPWMDTVPDVGLTNVINGMASVDQAIISTDTKNVSYLPSGPLPPNPTELLNSKESRELFRILSEKYDLVILDCPPCAGLSDMQVISDIVDGVLLVISLNHTSEPELFYTIQSLNQVGANVIGYVTNRSDMKGRGYYGYPPYGKG